MQPRKMPKNVGIYHKSKTIASYLQHFRHKFPAIGDMHGDKAATAKPTVR